jgi:hypothetical protein
VTTIVVVIDVIFTENTEVACFFGRKARVGGDGYTVNVADYDPENFGMKIFFLILILISSSSSSFGIV